MCSTSPKLPDLLFLCYPLSTTTTFFLLLPTFILFHPSILPYINILLDLHVLEGQVHPSESFPSFFGPSKDRKDGEGWWLSFGDPSKKRTPKPEPEGP